MRLASATDFMTETSIIKKALFAIGYVMIGAGVVSLVMWFPAIGAIYCGLASANKFERWMIETTKNED